METVPVSIPESRFFWKDLVAFGTESVVSVTE